MDETKQAGRRRSRSEGKPVRHPNAPDRGLLLWALGAGLLTALIVLGVVLVA